MLPVAPRFAISAPWRGANPMKLRAVDGRLALGWFISSMGPVDGTISLAPARLAARGRRPDDHHHGAMQFGSNHEGSRGRVGPGLLVMVVRSDGAALVPPPQGCCLASLWRRGGRLVKNGLMGPSARISRTVNCFTRGFCEAA
jgi:hypothetical protein